MVWGGGEMGGGGVEVGGGWEVEERARDVEGWG